MDQEYSNYSDFLLDRKFISWQLMPTSELDEYWHDFIEMNPQLEKEMKLAAEFLKSEGLNKKILDAEQQQLLLDNILETVSRKSVNYNKKRGGNKLWLYVFSGAVAAAIIGVFIFLNPSKQAEVAPDKELIVGELLNSKDIKIITKGETISFSKDIDVTLDEKGNAQIVDGESGVKNIEIDQIEFSSIVVPYGKRTTLTLADGSRVWLNSGSVLEFPAQFSSSRRDIRLSSGEMYIDVAKDSRPFYVNSIQFNAKVYGTSFNLSAYDDSPHFVALVNGSVELKSINGADGEVMLMPNELAIYNKNGQFEKSRVDVEQYITWKDGFLSFNKAQMSEVLQKVGRYYNLSFDYGKDTNLQTRTCTGKIYLSDNLDVVMTTVALLTSTNYEKKNNNIYITNKQN